MGSDEAAKIRRQAESRLGFSAKDYVAYGAQEMLQVRELRTRPGTYEIQVRRTPQAQTEFYEYTPADPYHIDVPPLVGANDPIPLRARTEDDRCSTEGCWASPEQEHAKWCTRG